MITEQYIPLPENSIQAFGARSASDGRGAAGMLAWRRVRGADEKYGCISKANVSEGSLLPELMN